MKKTELLMMLTDYIYATSSLNIVEAEEEAEDIMEEIYG